MSSDKRRWIRSKPLNGGGAQIGKILLDAKSAPIVCTVIDLSLGGAQLELSHQLDLPKKFEFLHGGVRKTCHLAWRRGYRIGISYMANVEKSVASVGLPRSSRGR